MRCGFKLKLPLSLEKGAGLRGENRCSKSGFVRVCKVTECSSQPLERTLRVA